MKKVLVTVLVLLVGGVAALASTFSAATLPPGAALAVVVPLARPPADMTLHVLHTGKMFSEAAFAYRGGSFGEARVFGMAGVLVRHPQGALLFDAGFGRNVDEHVASIPALMRATTKYAKETPAADQLRAAGIDPAALRGVVLTHAHWDHVSGLEDLRGVPVWLPQPELDFIRSGDLATELAASFGDLAWHPYGFPDGPYLGFDASYDVFKDGSVVLVPAPGHTPGSIIAFVNLPDGKRYALVGDLVWQKEGIELPAERPWLSRRLVDKDADNVRHWIVHMHRLTQAMPGLIVVPAHDRRVHETLPALAGTAKETT